MRLTERERDVLAKIGLHADESLRALAKRSGHQLHTVRHTIARLREQGVIRKLWMVDVFRLGWSRYQIFFSTNLSKAKVRKDFIRTISQSSRVSFFAEAGGDFDFELVVLARDIGELLEFLRRVSAKFGDVFFSRSLSVHHFNAYFPRKYFSQRPLKGDRLIIGDRAGRYDISVEEHQILHELSYAPDIEKKELAARVGVSTVTLEKRLQRLREEGVLRGALFSVRSGYFDGQNFSLLLKARGFSAELKDKLLLFAERHPHCTNFREAFGDADYEIGVEIEHQRELSALREEIGAAFGEALIDMRTIPRFEMLRYLPYPFSDEDVFSYSG